MPLMMQKKLLKPCFRIQWRYNYGNSKTYNYTYIFIWSYNIL